MTYTLKPIIKLWDSVGLGLIIEHPTGILISNQTGGTACLQTSVEGIYMPLGNDYDTNTPQLINPEIEIANYFAGQKYNGTGATHGIDSEDVEFITEVLSRFNLDEFIKIDIAKLTKSHEAWIYVNIYPDNSGDLLAHFNNELKGVLTWSNSD